MSNRSMGILGDRDRLKKVVEWLEELNNVPNRVRLGLGNEDTDWVIYLNREEWGELKKYCGVK